MKKNLKKIFQNRIFIFLLGGIIFSGVSVYAVTYFPSNQVTYDNKTSGLESSDVQGAIDELYNTCSQIVSSGNNLYYIESGSLINKYNIIKMNTNTGKTTTIASDLSGISNLIVSGDNLYYKEVDSFNKYNIIQLNTNTGKTTTIASDLSGISNLVVSGNNLYYIESTSSFNEYNIIKIDINTGKTTTIASDLSDISNLVAD